MHGQLNALLGSAEADRAAEVPGSVPAVLLTLRGDPGRPSLASVQEELAKLELIRNLNLPADLFDHASSRDGDQDKAGATTQPRLFHPDFANHAPYRDTSGRSFHANRRPVPAFGSAAVNEHPAASI